MFIIYYSFNCIIRKTPKIFFCTHKNIKLRCSKKNKLKKIGVEEEEKKLRMQVN